MPRRAYDEAYAEEVTLDDGTAVLLRLIRPEDKQMMLAAWERLSPESRYRRFLSAKAQLTARELRYLTELDNENHLAIGAARERDGRLEALGLARFIRLRDHPEIADAAIVVVDDVQQKGLARLLLPRLVAAARERGIERFTCDVLASNTAILGLLRSLAPDAIAVPKGNLVAVDIRLPDPPVVPPPPADQASVLYRILKLTSREPPAS